MSFIETKNQPYWLPVDSFIFKLMETHGSLAMLTPRIQSPWDMVRWDEIKHDNYEKFTFINSLKNFYLRFLEDNSIMGPKKYAEPSLYFDPKVDDKSLMKHPPVLGHWLSASRFLEESDYTKDHEYSYLDYMKVFNLSGRDKQRHCLFPSYEAILVTETKVWKIEDDRSEKINITKSNRAIYAKERIGTDYFYTPEGIMTNYDFCEFDSIFLFSNVEKGDPIPHAPKVGRVEKILESDFCNGEPVVTILQEFSYDLLNNQGFLNTPISIAYMMNFDIKSQFEVETDNSREFISKKRLHGNEYKETIIGRIRKRKECIPRVQKEGNMYSLDEIDYSLSEDRQTLTFNGIEIDYKKFTELKSIKNTIYSREQACFRDIEEFTLYNRYIEKLSSKKMINYFWFMYGCLPVNNILYEDLVKGVYMYSVLDLTDPNSYWTIDRRTKIKGINAKLPTEYDKGYILRIQQQWMRFLGLNFGLKKADFKHVIDFYYIDNSSRDIKIEKIQPDLLNSVYPKITSSKKSTKPLVSDRPEDKGIPNPTKDEKPRGTIILNKVLTESLSQNDLNDLAFMKEHNLLSPTGNTLYDEFMESKNEETFKTLKEDIIQNSKERLQTFIVKPAKEQFRRVVPADILELSQKLKSPGKDEAINDDSVDKIRTIIGKILNDQTEVVAKNMIKYLEAWSIIPKQDFEKEYEKVDGAYYLFDLNKSPRSTKYDTIVKILDNPDFERRSFYEGKKGTDLSNEFDKYQTCNQNQQGQGNQNQGGGVKTGLGGSKLVAGLIDKSSLDGKIKGYLNKNKAKDNDKLKGLIANISNKYIKNETLDPNGKKEEDNKKLENYLINILRKELNPDDGGTSFNTFITRNADYFVK